MILNDEVLANAILKQATKQYTVVLQHRNQLTIIEGFRASIMLHTTSALKRIGIRWAPQNIIQL